MHFIEFKNLDYEDTKDLKMSKYWLDKCLKQMKNCEKDCFINDKTSNISKSNFHKYLVDKNDVSLRVKPFESISLVFLYLKLFKSDDEEYCKNFLFNIPKYYYLVSKT